MIKRSLDLTATHLSYFLLGPRQVGKTHWIRATLSPDISIDLLNQTEFLSFSKDPDKLVEIVMAKVSEKPLLVFIDEIQRCPDLLNAIQRIMFDCPTVQFVMTGSSMRKLRRKGVNLLGGRAALFHMHPLTADELKTDFNLDLALNFGTLPRIYLTTSDTDKQDLLRGYTETYLKEEIQLEAMIRNIPSFAKFIELAAFENGNVLNFSNIAREVGVSSKALKEYFQILDDTLLGFWLFPYARSHRERLVKHPKFYFFDTGVCRALRNELGSKLTPGSSPYGYAFEHWVIGEVRRTLQYRRNDANMYFYGTNTGIEVDLILEWQRSKTWAIEIKSSASPHMSDLKGLKSFLSDHKVDRAICVCQTPRAYNQGDIEFLPWRDFLTLL